SILRPTSSTPCPYTTLFRSMAYRSGDDFTLLIVCTGNVCRSPAIERLFRSAFAEGSGITVHSAGTGALVGEPIQGPMVQLLEERSEEHTSELQSRENLVCRL